MGEHLNPTTFYGYKIQAGLGTPATSPFLSFGDGTGELNENSNNLKSRVHGNGALAFIKGGGIIREWSHTFDHIHSAAPLMLINKTAGLLDISTLVLGWDEATDLLWTMQDAKATSLSLRCDGGTEVGILTGTISGIGGHLAETTTAPTITQPTTAPFTSYDAIVTLGGSPFEIAGFDITISVQLLTRFVLAGAARTAGKKRLWDYLTEGNVDVSGSFRCLEPKSEFALGADCLTSYNSVIRFVDSCDAANILNIAITGLTPDTRTGTVPGDGAAGFTYPWTAKTAVLTAV